MAFFVTAVAGFLGMVSGIFPFLKEPDTGRVRIVRDIALRGVPP